MILCSKKTNVGSICAEAINLLVFLHATQPTKQSILEKTRRRSVLSIQYTLAITGYFATTTFSSTCTVDEVARTSQVVSRYC
jgi:hypothetical protein